MAAQPVHPGMYQRSGSLHLSQLLASLALRTALQLLYQCLEKATCDCVSQLSSALLIGMIWQVLWLLFALQNNEGQLLVSIAFDRTCRYCSKLRV